MKGDKVKLDKDDIKLITEIDQRSKSNTKRLDEHEDKISKLSEFYVALTKVNDKVDTIDSDVKEIKTDLQEIKDKPTKRYEQVVGYILSALVGGIIAFIFAKIGLK